MQPAAASGARTTSSRIASILVMGAAAWACSGAPEPQGIGGVRSESVLRAAPVAASTPAAPVTPPAAAASAVAEATAPGLAGEAIDATERQLRHELARAADPTEAALELAGMLCGLERHREALAAVDAALARADTPALHVCRAGVLRDVGRRRDAVDELLALRARHGAEGLHPALLFECAELQWMLRDADGAAETLRELERVHAGDPWREENRFAIDGLADEMRTRTAPPTVRVRDLLADLRGGDVAAQRVRLLDELCRIADHEGGTPGDNLHTRAIAIASADPSAAVRARAVQLGRPRQPDVAPFCEAALADAAPLVRQVAAQRCPDLAGGDAVPWLLDAASREHDAAAFLAMHGALSALVNGGPDLFPAAANDADTRAAVVTAWRERCRR